MRNIHIRVSIPSQSTSLDSIDSPSIPSSFHFYRAFYPSFTDLGSQSLEPSLIFIPCFQIQMNSNQFPSLTNTNSSISFITIINYCYYLKILLKFITTDYITSETCIPWFYFSCELRSITFHLSHSFGNNNIHRGNNFLIKISIDEIEGGMLQNRRRFRSIVTSILSTFLRMQ